MGTLVRKKPIFLDNGLRRLSWYKLDIKFPQKTIGKNDRVNVGGKLESVKDHHFDMSHSGGPKGDIRHLSNPNPGDSVIFILPPRGVIAFMPIFVQWTVLRRELLSESPGFGLER